MSSGENLCFMSWNSNGIITKLMNVRREIEKHERHVVFLQETRSNEVLENLEGWESFYTTQSSKNTGVAILIRKGIFDESRCTERDNDGCYIVVKCTLKRRLFTLVSLYNPPSNTRLIIKLINVIEKHAEGILLIGGDFNTTLNPYLDRNSETKNKAHSCLKPVVELFMTSFNLVDVWRRFHPTQCEFSYKSSKKNPVKVVKSRLDYLFVPEESMQYIKTCDISKEESCSDHQPVLFDIEIPKEESKKPEFSLDITEEESRLLSSYLTDKLLGSIYWSKPDLTKNPHTPQIKEKEIVNAIESLAVNEKEVDRQDGILLSIYVNNLYKLIPVLCAFFNYILQSMNIPESFNEAIKLSKTHYRFNVDYLILAIVLARRLHDHLESHSVEYTDDRKKKYKAVLFAFKEDFKEQPITVTWSVLRKFLKKEMNKVKTNPSLPDTNLIGIFDMVLKNSSSEEKLLYWGCPLTPVIMMLCLKSIANKMIKIVKDQTSTIFISRENVVAKFSLNFNKEILKKLKEKYKFVECKLVDDLKAETICSAVPSPIFNPPSP